MRFKLSALALVSMLGVGYGTAAAQQPQGSEPQRVDMSNDDRQDEGGMDMGWLGLIGLTGLLGMKRSAETGRRTTVGDHHTASTVSR